MRHQHSGPNPDKVGPDWINHRLEVCYDGTPWAGWQRQPDKPTVQEALERALEECWGRPLTVHGSGRTDAGVHALAQTAHFFAPPRFATEKLTDILNNHLPASIRVLRVRQVPRSFHARFSAVGKEYHYQVANVRHLSPFLLNRVWHVPRPLNMDVVREAMELLVGQHDFASFTSNPGYERESTVRTIDKFTVKKVGPGLWRWQIRGDGFLFRMVRNIMGAMVKVGHGRLKIEDIRVILAARDRSQAPNTAPAGGLYLARVFYRRIK